MPNLRPRDSRTLNWVSQAGIESLVVKGTTSMTCWRRPTLVLLCLLLPALGLAQPQLYFGNSGYTNFGEWYSYGWVGPYSCLAVKGGKFEYHFDPKAISSATPTYDIINRVSGKPEIKDVVHLTFFSKELAPGGTPCHSFVRVIIRGTQVLYAR